MEIICEILSNWRIFLEIIILFFIIYAILYYLRNTHGALILLGFLILLSALLMAARLLNLTVLAIVLETFYTSLPFLLLVLFQPELRRALAQLGSITILANRRRKEVISELVIAVQNMARRKCGALIVIEGKMHLQNIIDDAIPLDAKINSLMLESVFYPNSPLHDGAVIIRDDRIVAARAILPLTLSENISRQLGTRHRAAIGVSEESDAVTVLVSEETGSIGIAHGGKLYRDLSGDELQKMLDTLIVHKEAGELSETVRQLNEEWESSAEIISADVSEEEEENK